MENLKIFPYGMLRKRTDFLHKLSTDLVRKYDVIVLEDLNVSGMVKNRKLAKAISDLGWRQFRTFTEAKCEKYAREFRVIDRWEPTSQKCICCGFNRTDNFHRTYADEPRNPVSPRHLLFKTIDLP